MFTKELNEFMKRYQISSADRWAKVAGVSKSTISRALKGEAKDMGVETLLMLLRPYNGGSIDELLGNGVFSPEKEEAKKKIEDVIEVIENTEDIPLEQSKEIKNALAEVHEHIANETSDVEKCILCATYRDMIAELKQEKESKNRWLIRLFGLSFLLLGIVFVLIIAVVILSISLIKVLH